MKHLLLAIASIFLAASIHAQTVYTWSTSTTGTSWLNAANWTGNSGHFPGVDGNTSSTADGNSGDTATFSTVAFSGSSLGINMGTSSNTGVSTNSAANSALSLGAIDFAASKALTFGTSGAASGVLTLNGATVNSSSNVILRNGSSGGFTLTIANTAGGSGAMDLQLGNATDNKILLDGTNANISISSNITGSGKQLTLAGSGSGILTLSGTANTYSGGTVVSAATLKLSGSGTLGNTSGALTLSGGTLDINSTTQTVGALTMSSGIISSTGGIGSLTASSFGVQSGTISAKLSGSGALTKTTGSTVTLSGANNFSGGSTINGGTLSVTNSSALGNSSGSVAVNSSGTLNFNSVVVANPIVLSSGTLTASSGSAGTTGAVSGSGTIASSLTLSSFTSSITNLTTFDKLTLAGSATLTLTTLNLAFTSGASPGGGNLLWNSSQTWTIVDGTAGSSSVSLTALGSNSTGYSNGNFSFSTLNGDLSLIWTATAIPEPATYATIIGALTLTGVIYKKRRQPKVVTSV